ncbi:hypothetical protein ACGFIY_21360 [Micromonospora chersina]|uniref:hypothetical protein n=1 Tax=Micromonospora chersina TaxID=47854 RepID=UPI0037235717
MPDPSRDHAKAQFDLVRAALPENVDVYLAKVDKADADLRWPYLVLWPAPVSRVVDSADGYAGQVRTRTQITGAGTTPDEVLAVLDRASAALHCVTPAIPGRSCGWIRVDEDTFPSIVVDLENKTYDGRDIYTGFIFAELTSTLA